MNYPALKNTAASFSEVYILMQYRSRTIFTQNQIINKRNRAKWTKKTSRNGKLYAPFSQIRFLKWISSSLNAVRHQKIFSVSTAILPTFALRSTCRMKSTSGFKKTSRKPMLLFES